MTGKFLRIVVCVLQGDAASRPISPLKETSSHLMIISDLDDIKSTHGIQLHVAQLLYIVLIVKFYSLLQNLRDYFLALHNQFQYLVFTAVKSFKHAG